MASLCFDPDSTSIRLQKSWTSLFYSSMNGPGFKTLVTTKKIHMLDLAFYRRKVHEIPSTIEDYWLLMPPTSDLYERLVKAIAV